MAVRAHGALTSKGSFARAKQALKKLEARSTPRSTGRPGKRVEFSR